jgi:penicillin-binding protein 1C
MARDLSGDKNVIRVVMRMFVQRWRAWVPVAAVVCLAAALWLRLGPLPAGLLDRAVAPSTVVVDRHGEILYESRSALGTRGTQIDAATLPAGLVTAALAAEDVRFYSHVGVDPVAIARALWRNLRAGRTVEGGSTITQQVAKLLLQRQSGHLTTRGWTTKVREAVIALRLEHRLTKREILALYLNIAPYGNQIDGAMRASLVYFGRPADTLTPGEAAFLAALPQQPTRGNPRRDPAAARARQLRILDAEEARGWLTPADRDVAVRERVSLAAEVPAFLAPHFVEHVLADATASDRPRRIETTLDATLERTIDGIVSAHRRALDDHHADNVAVVVLDNRTSEWLAWEGSGDYGDAHGGAIDGVTSPRQPGSALKPFTYAVAFERGGSPGRVLADVPAQYSTAEPGIMYSPRNYDGQFRGPLLARAALAGSENVPAVALASEVGVPAIARLLRQSGITTLTRDSAFYGLGLTLGNAEVRLDELVSAYAMFARGGEYVAARSIRAIDGRAPVAAAGDRLVSPRTAFWITDILADPEARAYIFGRGGSLEFPFPVAAKTGTSTSYHDNWAIGYTHDVTVGVWVGNFDRTPLHDSSGVTGAGPIFHDVMMAAVERVRGSLPIGDTTPILPPVADVHQVTLCALSGLAAGDACPSRITEWLPSNARLSTCSWHRAGPRGVITLWPEPYRTWARSADASVAASDANAGLTSQREESGAARSTAALAIVSPLPGATFLLDPTLRSDFQALSLRAQGGAPGPLEWRVDEGTVDATTTASPRWPLARGMHRITVRDNAGSVATTTIVVR